MDLVKLLDVTLRDGGYKNNFNFLQEQVEKILFYLDSAGIHYIEIGYRNGPLKLIPNIGQTGLCHASYITMCRSVIKKAKLTVIFHPKNVTLHDLEEMRYLGVEVVRICFQNQDPMLSLQCIEMSLRLGFEVFVNLTRMSQYTKEEILKLVSELKNTGISAIYLADSNGSLTPFSIQELFTPLTREHPSLQFGFHAHDNLFLAQANAATAINHGVTLIDSSLLGIGKGAGNLRTEGIASYLYTRKNYSFNVRDLLEAANYVDSIFKEQYQALPAKDIILGIFNLSQDDAIILGKFNNIADYYNKAEQYCHIGKLREISNEKSIDHRPSIG